ncbi:hypothetical protein SKB0068_07200 [Staphylococcus hominis subsp. novobiosepticus]|uniref:hypothetical protein n=1 Tax=Staphylococcus hominis TaxID=1290 RepID=UPI00324B8E4E
MAEDPKFVIHGSQVQKWTDDIQQLKQERDSFRKQRDELINDMQNVKRKAEAFDEIEGLVSKTKSAEDLGECVLQLLIENMEADHER